MQRTIYRLLCICAFEPEFFARHGIEAIYIGHPLTRLIQPSASREELRQRYHIPEGAQLIALLPGSRRGEISRHLPVLIETVRTIVASGGQPALRFILAIPPGTGAIGSNFRELVSGLS